MNEIDQWIGRTTNWSVGLRSGAVLHIDQATLVEQKPNLSFTRLQGEQGQVALVHREQWEFIVDLKQKDITVFRAGSPASEAMPLRGPVAADNRCPVASRR